MRTCFVPFCDVKNKDQPNRTMFLVPRDQAQYAQWAKALPNVRTLRYNDKVCYLHFRPDDIVYTFDHCINGKLYKIKRDRPRLKPDAVPCLEMTTKEELLSYRVKPRLISNPKTAKMCNDNSISDHVFDLIMEEDQQENEPKDVHEEFQDQQERFENYAIIVSLEDDIQEIEQHELTENASSENQINDLIVEGCNYESSEEPATVNDDNNEPLLVTKRFNLFNLLYDNAHEVLAPNTLWGIHRCPNRSLVCFSYMEVLKMQVTKMICIRTDGSVQLLLNGNVIKTWQLLQDIVDLDSLTIILNRVDMWRFCAGKLSNANCDIIVEPDDDDNCWLNEDNDQVFLCKMCLITK